MRQVSRSVAIVIPEMGFDEEPISPVRRDDTVTKRKPKTTMRTAPTNLVPIPASRSIGAAMIAAMRTMIPIPTNFMDRSLSVRGTAAAPAPPPGAELEEADVAQPLLEAVPDGRERAEQADDAAGGDGARADVEDVGRADAVRVHVRDGDLAGRKRALEVLAEELDHRDQDQVGEDAAPAHEGRDPRADDVADPEELRGDLRAHGGPLERARRRSSPGCPSRGAARG